MNRFLPRANAALVSAQGSATTEFRRFLESLAESADNDGLRAIVEDAIKRLEILESIQRGNVIGLSSIDSSGNLASGDVYLNLQNDVDTAEPGSFYGAEKVSGQKGWHPLLVDSLRDVDAPTPADGDALVWSDVESKWIPAPVAFSFGNPLTDESGNLLTDQNGNFLTDGQLSVNWSNVEGTPTTLAGYGITDGNPELSTKALTPYTLGTLPSVTPAYRSIYVTNLTGSPGPCYSDGTNWRRYSDDSIAT